jgi:hypothetical protein
MPSSKSGTQKDSKELSVTTDLEALFKTELVENEDAELEEEYLSDGTGVYTSEEERGTTPLLVVAQGGSQPVKDRLCKPGSFWDYGTETELEPPIVVIPVLYFHARTRWASEIGDRALCGSTNAKVGVGDPGGSCEKCPNKKRWIEDERRMEGDCDLQRCFLVRTVGLATLSLLKFYRTAMPIGLEIGRNLEMKNKKGQKRAIFTYAFRLGTRQDRKGKNTYFVPTLEPHPENNEKRLILTRFPQFKSMLPELRDQNKEADEQYRNNQLLPMLTPPEPTTVEVLASPEDTRAAIEEQAAVDEATPF